MYYYKFLKKIYEKTTYKNAIFFCVQIKTQLLLIKTYNLTWNFIYFPKKNVVWYESRFKETQELYSY
jgi:hypothetical protein